MSTQGRCGHCRIYYFWGGKGGTDRPRLSDVPCPRCGGALLRTTSYTRWPREDVKVEGPRGAYRLEPIKREDAP